jgi:uncharacterized protein
MRFTILADVHDNLINLKKCLDWSRENDIEALICCGDLANSDTLDCLAKNFKGRIHLIMGNCDNYDELLVLGYPNITYHDRKGGKLDIDGKLVGFCHEPYHIKHLFHQAKFDLIFYGHTHKPWESRENGVRLVNPGTLGGVFQKSTFAVWDSNDSHLELKVTEEL